MAELRSINGDEFGAPGKPDADLVEMLEDALAKARDGHLVCAAIVHDSINGCGYSFAGMVRKYSMVGAVEALKKHLLQ